MLSSKHFSKPDFMYITINLNQISVFRVEEFSVDSNQGSEFLPAAAVSCIANVLCIGCRAGLSCRKLKEYLPNLREDALRRCIYRSRCAVIFVQNEL